MNRQIDLGRGTSEFSMLEEYATGSRALNTTLAHVEDSPTRIINNPIAEAQIGRYRPATASKNITGDTELIEIMHANNKSVPFFCEAGPRRSLSFDPKSVKAAILTAGGIAPGLHSVIHAIVQRHRKVYKMNKDEGGKLYGIPDGFLGFCRNGQHFEELTPDITAEWLSLGGSQLGSVRHFGNREKHPDTTRRELAEQVATRLRQEEIDILYVLGGDGSMRVAHEVAKLVKDKSIACVPKTMDNDVLWVSESFGFATAVEEATRVINTLHREAESTRRICIIELFGAESGFVAANASMASGQVDLVLIPEVFRCLIEDKKKQTPEYVPNACKLYWDDCIEHIRTRILEYRKNPHAVIVMAEGVSTIFQSEKISMNNGMHPPDSALLQLKTSLRKVCRTVHGEETLVFENQPRHNIRAVPANAHDQIYCERLGALAVDNALAGYTDFMVSQWMTEYVLVPLELATSGQKTIPLEGVFWKQVMNITGQPSHEKHRISKPT